MSWQRVNPSAKQSPNVEGAGPPNASKDSSEGYWPGILWADIVNNKIYVCRDATEGAAIWIEINPGAVQGGVDFIYRPGGSPSGNVYSDFDNLYADLIVNQDRQRIVWVDDSIVSPVPFPTGDFDMVRVAMAGAIDRTVRGTVPEGTIFRNLRELTWNLDLEFTGSTPPISDFDLPVADPRDDNIVLWRGGNLRCSGSGPFLDIPDGNKGGAVVVFGGGLRTDIPGNREVVRLGDGSQLLVLPDMFGVLGQDSVESIHATSVLLLAVNSANSEINQTQSNFAGFKFQIPIGQGAYNVSFDPSNTILSQQWLNPAIDELSNGIKTGSVNIGDFSGNPLVSSVTFLTAMPSADYAVETGQIDNGSGSPVQITISNKTVNGFDISLNAASAPNLVSVDWVARLYNNL